MNPLALSLTVNSVTQLVGAETIKLTPARGAVDPAATLLVNSATVFSITQKDPTKFGLFKPGASVAITITPPAS